MRLRFPINTSFLCVLSVSAVNVSLAGDLNPPAGVVSPTHKTLTEVEPRTPISAETTPGDNDASPSTFKITQPGSYYLTGNVTGESTKHGIEIASSGVTLDLMGFELLGVSGSLDGVVTGPNALHNIVVRNGSVRDWGSDGMNLSTTVAIGCAVTGVHVSENGGFGMLVGGGFSVTGCTAYINTSAGFFVNSGSTVTECASYDNGGDGFSTSTGCAFFNCTATTNGNDGFNMIGGCTLLNCAGHFNAGDGISVSAGCSVTKCSALSNSVDGIRAGTDCIVVGNACDNNGNTSGDGAGIHVTGSGNRIEGNHCMDADRGIDVDVGGNIIIRNTCSGNTTNWDIAANNYYGPIIDRTGVGTAAVNGNTAPGTLASTDFHSNFTY